MIQPKSSGLKHPCYAPSHITWISTRRRRAAQHSGHAQKLRGPQPQRSTNTAQKKETMMDSQAHVGPTESTEGQVLTITVSDPKKESEGMNSYVSY